MVRLIRSAEPRLGMFPQTIAFAKKIAAYVKKAYKVDIRVFTDSKGVIFWIVDYKDYADYEKVLGKITKDKKYWQIVSATKNLLVEGSVFDEVITSID